MFERYTERARRSIFFARAEAGLFGSKYIERDHLLLGLLRDSPDVFRPVFRSPDAPEAIRNEYEARIPRQTPVPTSVDLPLSHPARRALALAEEEATRLRQGHIGVEHLMLGLLRDEQSDIAQDLQRYGMTLEGMRNAAGAQS
jgi:ATP-dependent Clp protease ATP-binding subunit ClpC